MDRALEHYRGVWRELTLLGQLNGLLEWDQQTGMPAGAAAGRGEQAAWIGDRRHELLTAPELGDALDELAGREGDGVDADEIRRAGEVRDRAVRVPDGFAGRLARAAAEAHTAWEAARAGDDFERFAPHLEEIVRLNREYAGFFPEAAHPYDALLGNYEPGLTKSRLEAVFTPLKTAQVALLGEILEAQAARSFRQLPGSFPAAAQSELSSRIRRWLGLAPERCRLDQSVHPFTVTVGYDDVRITTHYHEKNLSSFFSTLHEGGHALYELNIDPALRFTALGEVPSLALHESQSRFWENMVGRSLAWCQYLLPQLARLFPALEGWTAEEFFRAVNRVEPGLIRIDADEVTYNLHIMLRFELETALVEGALEVRDLPQAWNEKVRQYLGLEVPDYASGVLQDVHWAGGAIGYFPTYALGNLVSAQFYRQMRSDLGDCQEAMRSGDLSGIAGWLRERVHRHGARYHADELVRRVTGEDLSGEAYLEYLRGKYL